MSYDKLMHLERKSLSSACKLVWHLHVKLYTREIPDQEKVGL